MPFFQKKEAVVSNSQFFLKKKGGWWAFGIVIETILYIVITEKRYQRAHRKSVLEDYQLVESLFTETIHISVTCNHFNFW
jgi:hypothetical protein